MIPESIWPGMFQAKAGIGSAVSVTTATHASAPIWPIDSFCLDVICHGQSTRSTTTKGVAPAIELQ
jgi:hypothetical protein